MSEQKDSNSKTYTFEEIMNEIAFNNQNRIEKERKNDPNKVISNIVKNGIDNMDDNNKKACNILATEGASAAVKHMFTDPKTGKPLSYAEMRSLYG